MPLDEFEELMDLAQHAAKERVDVAKCDLSRVSYDARLESGAAVDVISALTEEVDVVVMATLSRSEPAAVLIGNTAETECGIAEPRCTRSTLQQKVLRRSMLETVVRSTSDSHAKQGDR